MNRLLSLSLVFALACEPPPPPVPGAITAAGTSVVTVDGNAITQEMLDITLTQIPPQMRKQLEQSGQVGQLKEQLIVGEVLYREALTQKMQDDPKIKLQLALAERNALADALLDKVIEERSNDARIQKYYDDHKVQYARPQLKPRLIVAESEAVANELVAALKGGADFAQLAREKSKDPRSASSGGELPWMKKEDLGPMGEKLAEAAKGDIVGPMAAPQGGAFLVFKVDDKRDATPLDEVKDDIKEKLKSELAQEYITELKAKAKIVEAGATGATVTPNAPGAAPGAAPAGGAPPAAPAAAPADHK